MDSYQLIVFMVKVAWRGNEKVGGIYTKARVECINFLTTNKESYSQSG
jgi:hypothetical protein